MALGDPTRQEDAITRLKAFQEAVIPIIIDISTRCCCWGTCNSLSGDAATRPRGRFNSSRPRRRPDYQMAANVKIARVKLARGDVAGARAAFDAVVGTATSSPAEESRRFEAMLGQASCLQQAKSTMKQAATDSGRR